MDFSSRLLFNPSTSYLENLSFLRPGDGYSFPGSHSIGNIDETLKRRLCFDSTEEYLGEVYYDEHSQEKKRRLTSEQVLILEKSFEAENKLEPERKTQLAEKLGLQPRQVAIWFQNRRARNRTKQLERNYDDLKASYDSLLASYDYVLKENDKLKFEVIHLAEKLHAGEEEKATAQVTIETSGLLLAAIQHNVKVEGPPSSGSTMVNEGRSQKFIDTADSYFPYETYTTGSEDGDDCKTYFSSMFAIAEVEEQHEGGEAPVLWVWNNN